MNKAYPSSVKSALGTPAESSFSTFNRALEEYLRNIPRDKKKFEFIQLCRDAGTNATPKDINLELQEKGALRARSGPAQKIFSKIMKVLMDYSEVIGQMGLCITRITMNLTHFCLWHVVSAQPLPCAIIWGALKVIVEVLICSTFASCIFCLIPGTDFAIGFEPVRQHV